MADEDSTSTVPAPLQTVADAVARANSGEAPPERTVRELIGWFDHRGRGVNVNDPHRARDRSGRPRHAA